MSLSQKWEGVGMKMQTKRHMAPFGPSCAQSCFVPRFAQISSYQAEISYVPSTCTAQRRPTKDYNSRSTVSSNPLGMSALQRLARDSTPLLNSALISPIIHGKCMCVCVLATVHGCSTLTPFSPLPLNCSTIDHEGLGLQTFIGFQRGPSDCCQGLGKHVLLQIQTRPNAQI